MEKTKIHIGEKIKEKAEEIGISDAELSRRINTSRQNIADIFKRSSIDTLKLFKISKALDFDFFTYYRINDPQTKFDNKQESKAKVVIELELNSDEILKFGLKDKVLEMFKK